MGANVIKAIQDRHSDVLLTGKKKPVQNVELFLSFDISNSTKLKIKYHDQWPQIIDTFLSNKFDSMEYWKFIGDEVIYRIEVNDIGFICKIIKNAYSYIYRLESEIRKALNIQGPLVKNPIMIKGTLWIALTDHDAKSYEYNFSFFPTENSIDYSGKNIDEGFRLTKHSSMHKIAIDPKIVYIFFKAKEIFPQKISEYNRDRNNNLHNISVCEDTITELDEVLDQIHLIGHAPCKGVWDGQPYPIYWYCRKIPKDENGYIDESGTRADGIRYDDYLNGEHVWGKSASVPPLSEVDEAPDDLEAIFIHVGIMQEVNTILDKLEPNKTIYRFSTSKRPNLYYMVACINPVSGKVLIAKRGEGRKHLKNVWDFGNVKYQSTDIKDSVEKEYKNIFGIDIDIMVDDSRDKNIKPYGLCTIYRNCKKHNGLLFYATIKNVAGLSDDKLAVQIREHIEKHEQYEYKQYEDVRFIDAQTASSEFQPLTLDEIRIDSEKATANNNTIFEPVDKKERCIMYFKNSIEGAIREYEKTVSGSNEGNS